MRSGDCCVGTSMIGRLVRLPLTAQIAAPALLFAASLFVLWVTGISVLERERRRVSARRDLAVASENLAIRGAAILSGIAPWMAAADNRWAGLERSLSEAAAGSLANSRGVEGGYFYNRNARRLLGFAFPTAPRPPRTGPGQIHPSGPPPREADLVETLLDAAIRKGRPLFVIAEVPPSLVALQTAPVSFEGRVVGASWAMTRLVDPGFRARSDRGYWLATGLALAGVALALALAAHLARTVRQQAIERARLQTELRRGERLAALGRLLAGVAHEVRNPLAGIRSTAQLWQRGMVRDDVAALNGMVEEVDRLERIVSRLLQFSRADAQDLAPGDLGAVLDEVARLVATTAEAQGVGLKLTIEPGLPQVEMSAPALIQVFRNLATNALQAMPQGGTLRLEARAERWSGVVVGRVLDTGAGLSDEAGSHLFEPFYTTKGEGTGLGLAIAREIALAHRGELRGANRPDGPGAVFTLTLPVLKSSGQRASGLLVPESLS